MPQLIPKPHQEPIRDEPKKSAWGDFLRRLAFWKVAKQEKLDRMFDEAVHDLHPGWEKKRLARKAAQD